MSRMVPSTSTSVTVLPPLGRYSPLHLRQTQLGWAISHLAMHLLWTHRMHCEHWMGLLPTSIQQTAQGYLPDVPMASLPTLETRNLFVFVLTRSPLLSAPAFYALSLEMYSTWLSAISTVISIDELPWHTSAELTRNRPQYHDEEQLAKDRVLMLTNSHPLLYWPLIHTRPWTLEYMPCMTHAAYSSTPRLLKAHSRIFLGTRSGGFLKVDEGKVEQCISSDVLLLVANNEDSISGTSTRHNNKLHFVDVYHLVDVRV